MGLRVELKVWSVDVVMGGAARQDLSGSEVGRMATSFQGRILQLSPHVITDVMNSQLESQFYFHLHVETLSSWAACGISIDLS